MAIIGVSFKPIKSLTCAFSHWLGSLVSRTAVWKFERHGFELVSANEFFS